MQQLKPEMPDLVHGGGAAVPTPVPPARPAPIFHPVFPIDP